MMILILSNRIMTHKDQQGIQIEITADRETVKERTTTNLA